MLLHTPTVDRPAATAARYGTALAIALAIVAIRWLLAPLLADRLIYIVIPIATVLALWRCGIGPAIAAFAVSFGASHALFGLSSGDYQTGVVGWMAYTGVILGETLGLSWLVWSKQLAERSLANEVQAAVLQQHRLASEIAERREVAATLRASREEFEVLATKAPVGILRADATGRCTFVNEQWCHMTGYASDEMLGYDWSRCVHPDDLVATMSRWEASVREQQPYSNQLRLVRKDGGIRFVTARALPLHGEDGTVTGFIGTVIDTTDLARAQESLEHKQKLLRNLIDIQEQEKQLLCNEFHDGLIQYAVGSKMMLESCRDDHLHELPAAVSKTVGDVIDFLRKGIEDGRRVILGIRPAVLDDLGLAAAITDLAEQFSAAPLEITTMIDPDVGPLPKELQTSVYRIVQESLNNAHKHSNARHARIELRRDGDALRLNVADDGCGFDPATARNRGFGLVGMSERVQLAGGEFSVESASGTGTVVAVRLPIPRPE
jgi:PAS domain S-box-containing protein